MEWTSPDQWARLKAGIDCPMCADLHLDVNAFSYEVAELPLSYVRLPKNQYLRGWTLVALKRHASELFELAEDELLGFWKDVTRVARALDRLYQPAKINYGVSGNLCPHVHCHLVVQTYASDPSKPLDMTAGEVLLSEAEYRGMVDDLQRALDV